MASRILVIDDTPTVLDYLELIFTRQDFEVARAGSGSRGVQLANELVPDVILIDVMMPVVDGYEVCRRLRADPLTSRIPLLLYSAAVGEEVRGQALAAGADEFLGKEISHTELVARVREWLASRAMPGGFGEPNILQVGLNLAELLQVELVWMLGLYPQGMRTLAVACERGEQEARRVLERVGCKALIAEEGSFAGECLRYGRLRVDWPLDEIRALEQGEFIARSLAEFGANSLCVAPLKSPQSECGMLVCTSPSALARDANWARAASIGVDYAAMAIGQWGGLPKKKSLAA